MGSRVLYLDLVGGAAGDMLLAALLDLGAPFSAVRSALDALGLEDVVVHEREVYPESLRARQVDVIVGGALADSTSLEGTPNIRTEDEAWQHARHEGPGHHHAHGRGHRPWRVIRERLNQAELPSRARQLAQDAFRRLAEAEAHVHGVPAETVEFHEVGADDAIADIVGTAVAFDALGIDRVIASPLPLGRGLSRGAHGALPIPGPATLEILRGAPTVMTPLESESVTPTGAALVRALADDFGPIPSMRLERIGVGAGHKRWPDRPNVVRALLGVSSVDAGQLAGDVVLVETNLDDMNPEHLEPLFSALFTAGAVDAWAIPATFKKGRVGLVVSALVPPEAESDASRAFFVHSPTLGVRIRPMARRVLERHIDRIETAYGTIRVKRSARPDGTDHSKPEHDDVRCAAQRARVPLREVEDAVARELAIARPASPVSARDVEEAVYRAALAPSSGPSSEGDA